MTISQALRRIAKLKGELRDHLERAAAAVKYEVRRPPAFPFDESMGKAEAARNELILLEADLRGTNARTKVDYRDRSISLSEATCRLQELRGQIAWFKALQVLPHADAAGSESQYDATTGRPVAVPVAWRCEMPEAKRADMVAALQAEFDALNDAVEGVNHYTNLWGDL